MPLNPVVSTDSERLLEDTLANHPDLLDENMQLVGRQILTESGQLDLLGVDENGRLTVFELKRDALRRDAVAQIIDYASYLDNLDDEKLLELLTNSAQAHGIGSFGNWYAETHGKSLSSLRPVQITLVGLGVDERANRMVRYLANGEMPISLLTFSGYHHNGQTLLARQVEVAAQETVVENAQVIHRPKGSLKDRVIANVRAYSESWPEGCELFDAVRNMFRENLPGFIEGGSKRQDETAGYRLNYRPRVPGPHQFCAGVRFEPSGHVVPYFLPLALRKLPEQFARILEEIPDGGVWPANASMETANDVSFGLTPANWELHKDKLVDITRSVYAAFTADETGGGMDENGDC